MNIVSMRAFRDEYLKIAAPLTAEQREDMPKKDFAVGPKSSNTGEEAYPIPDRRHAAVALGMAKMHHDSADLAKVRAKVKAKYPDMLDKAASAGSIILEDTTKVAFLERVQPGTERYHSSRMLALLNQLPARVYYAEEDPEDYKIASAVRAKFASSFDRKAALEALIGEVGPAAGATIGATLAGGLGKSPLSGAAMGYGVGSIPELLLHRKGHAAAAP